MATIKQIYEKATKPVKKIKKKLDDRMEWVKQQDAKAALDPKTYNPYAEPGSAISKKSVKMFNDGVKAIPEGYKARANVRKNIKSMANRDAVAELKRTKDLPADQRGNNDAFNRAEKAYKKTKKDLEKQIPRKSRNRSGFPYGL
jgi:uncharacterized protein YjgD (DUF1641 family)